MTTSGGSGLRWGFIGSGKMATALVSGMIRSGTAGAESILASDPDAAARSALAAATGVAVTDSNRRVARESDVLVLSVKPQVIAQSLEDVRPEVTPEHLVISITTGVSLATLGAGLGAGRRLARVMPNTPGMVGAGASGYCLGPHARESDEAVVHSCVGAVGRAFRVPEPLLDAVTGLSGSGPGIRLRDDRGAVGRWHAPLACPARSRRRWPRRPSWDWADGPRDGPAPGGAQGPGDQPRRDDDHGPARPGAAAASAPALIDAVEAATRRDLRTGGQGRSGRAGPRGGDLKLGLISDVHGDPLALELAWAHLTTLAADQIICAGDVVGYGPFPDRVVAFLKEHAIDCVRGNHDRWALERGLGEPDEFGGGTPSAETLEFLDPLPFYRLIADGSHIAVIVHGSPRGDMEFVTHEPSAGRPPGLVRDARHRSPGRRAHARTDVVPLRVGPGGQPRLDCLDARRADLADVRPR